MKIINTTGISDVGLVIAAGKRLHDNLNRFIQIRPFTKTATVTIDTMSDVFVLIIKMPTMDVKTHSMLIVNANEFRIVSAAENTVIWAGGKPPFTAWVGDRDLPGQFVNVDLTVYTITKGEPRQFLVLTRHQKELVDDDYDWWASDTDLVDGKAVQTGVGVWIQDSAVPPRKIFAPFGGLIRHGQSIYEHFGPPTWCVPLVQWLIDDTAGLRYPYWKFHDVDVEIPGTTNEFLPGEFTHTANGVPYDAEVPVPPGSYTMVSVFNALDTVHYHPAETTYGCIIYKGLQSIAVTTQRISSVRPDYPMYYYVGDIWRLTVNYSNPSGNALVKTPTGCTISGDDATITATTGSSVACSIAGNSLYEPASYLYQLAASAILASNQTLTVSFDPETYQVGESTTVSAVSSEGLLNFTYLLQNDVAHMGDMLGQVIAFRKASKNGSVLIVRVIEAGNAQIFSCTADTPLTIAKGDPVVVFGPQSGGLGTITYGDTLAGLLSAYATWPHEETQLTGGTFTFWEIREGSNPADPTQQITSENVVLRRDPYYPTGVRYIYCDFTPSADDADNWNGGVTLNWLTVARKNLSITAHNLSKTYGSADPALTYTVSGLVTGDSVSGQFVRAAGESVGSYLITENQANRFAVWCGTEDRTDNYNLTVTGGTFSIVPAPITLGFSARGSFGNATVTFYGGSGAGYSVTWSGTLTQISVMVVGPYNNATSMYLNSFNSQPCFQANGYYKISDNAYPNNYAILYYSEWFPIITNITPALHSCSGENWQTLFSYSCPSFANLIHLSNGTWTPGTIRVLDPGGIMAVTWGYLEYSDSTGHGPQQVCDILGLTMSQANSWFFNTNYVPLYTPWSDIHVVKIERCQ